MPTVWDAGGADDDEFAFRSCRHRRRPAGYLGSRAAFAANENIPVLLVSGYPGTSDQLERLRYPLLAKPFKLDELTAEQFESSRKVMKIFGA